VAKHKSQALRRQEFVPGMRPVRGAVPGWPAAWIFGDEACQQIMAAVGSWQIVVADLAASLRSGKIHAIDWVTCEGRPFGAYELSSAFWKAHKISIDTSWEGHPRLTVKPRDFHPGQHNIYFRRADMDALWLSAPAAEPAAKSGRRKPGPRPQHDWPEQLAAELIRRAIAGELQLNNDSKLADELGQFFEDRYGWQPDNSGMRKLIAALLAPSRNSP
jgi:hypothetical protein